MHKMQFLYLRCEWIVLSNLWFKLSWSYWVSYYTTQWYAYCIVTCPYTICISLCSLLWNYFPPYICLASHCVIITGPQKKLRFAQQNGSEAKANDIETTGRITKIRFSVSRNKQNIGKPKREKRNAQSSAVSNDVPRFTTGCNSIESCTQSAIAFSQRQMQDIECLVAKLANELKSMKEIAEDRLCYEASSSISLKYKPNEVRFILLKSLAEFFCLNN